MAIRFISSLLLLSAVFSLTHCASTPPPLPLNGPRSSAVMTPMTLVPVIELLGSGARATPDVIIYIRFTGRAVTESRDLFVSNYSRDRRSYFFNAPPGRYQAVAAFLYPWPNKPPPRAPNDHTLPEKTSSNHVVFFSEELSRQTRVDVGPGQVACMSRMSVKMDVTKGRPDQVQRHAESLIAPGQLSAKLTPTGRTSFIGWLKESEYIKPGDCNEIIADDLGDSEWGALLPR